MKTTDKLQVQKVAKAIVEAEIRELTFDEIETVSGGATYGAILGSASGAVHDLYGTGFSGSPSLENTY
ncbi:MAG TPA: hypothetical protein VL492_09935 [Methylovirgula sp.]|jgi:hypothetical protein|nr:hypothetical protein [Methylovirgula sp.]